MSGEHWEPIYATRPVDELSWYQQEPAVSVRLVTSTSDPSAAVVDVGSGASSLVDRLLDAGYREVTVVDVSATALETVRSRLSARSDAVAFVDSDVLDWAPDRDFDVWHDRAVFHFLTGDGNRARYAARAAAALRPGGVLIVATFAADGPTHCSGLPVRRQSAADLAAAFERDFAPLWHERETHVTPAGVTQPFTWAVLRRR